MTLLLPLAALFYIECVAHMLDTHALSCRRRAVWAACHVALTAACAGALYRGYAEKTRRR